jgi:hypothetical protein
LAPQFKIIKAGAEKELRGGVKGFEGEMGGGGGPRNASVIEERSCSTLKIYISRSPPTLEKY